MVFALHLHGKRPDSTPESGGFWHGVMRPGVRPVPPTGKIGGIFSTLVGEESQAGLPAPAQRSVAVYASSSSSSNIAIDDDDLDDSIPLYAPASRFAESAEELYDELAASVLPPEPERGSPADAPAPPTEWYSPTAQRISASSSVHAHRSSSGVEDSPLPLVIPLCAHCDVALRGAVYMFCDQSYCSEAHRLKAFKENSPRGLRAQMNSRFSSPRDRVEGASPLTRLSDGDSSSPAQQRVPPVRRIPSSFFWIEPVRTLD